MRLTGGLRISRSNRLELYLLKAERRHDGRIIGVCVPQKRSKHWLQSIVAHITIPSASPCIIRDDACY